MMETVGLATETIKSTITTTKFRTKEGDWGEIEGCMNAALCDWRKVNVRLFGPPTTSATTHNPTGPPADMKEVIFTTDLPRLVVCKTQRTPTTFENGVLRILRSPKEDTADTFRVEVELAAGGDKPLSRPVTSRSHLTLAPDAAHVMLSDRRGDYTIQCGSPEENEKLYEQLAAAKAHGKSDTDDEKTDSPRLGSPHGRSSLTRSALDRPSRKGSMDGPHWPKRQTHERERGHGVNMGTYRASTDVPTSKFHEARPNLASGQARYSFIKRKQLSCTATSPLLRANSRSEGLDSPSGERPAEADNFFAHELAQKSAHEEGPVAGKTVRVDARWDPSVYFTQILLSDPNSFTCAYDKKLVPKPLYRCMKNLSAALQKKWVLCGVLEWDQLAKVEEVESAGVKKTTDPYLVAEYFLRLLQEASPLIVYDHFEPTQSFLEISGQEEQENQYINDLIGSLPEESKALVGTLITFLKSALKQEEINHISQPTLAALYGPYLISPTDLAYKKPISQPLKSPLVL